MKRFPKKQEIINAFLSTVTVINFWAVIVYLYNFPGLIKQLTVTELLAVLGYILNNALIESTVIIILLLLLAALLPARFLRINFAVRSAVAVILSTMYIIPFHINIPKFSLLVFDSGVLIFISLWTVLLIAELVLFHLSINRYPKFSQAISKIIERVVVLGAIYLGLDLIALVYVVSANWSIAS